MRFFRQEYWNGLPFLPLGDLPNPGIEPMSPVSLVLQADSLPAEPSGKPPYVLFNLLLAALDLCCCTWAFSRCSGWGPLSSGSAWAPDCSSFSCGTRAPECRLSSCGARVYLPQSMWDLPGWGIEPAALTGMFLTSGPPRKSQWRCFLICLFFNLKEPSHWMQRWTHNWLMNEIYMWIKWLCSCISHMGDSSKTPASKFLELFLHSDLVFHPT